MSDNWGADETHNLRLDNLDMTWKTRLNIKIESHCTSTDREGGEAEDTKKIRT